jgi:hypothetical protein
LALTLGVASNPKQLRSCAPMPRPRFTLRVMLAVTVIVALGSAIYWHGWDRFVRYRAQQDFLAEAGQLKRGELISHFWHPTFTRQPRPFVHRDGSYDAKGKYFKYMTFRWPDALFVVFWRCKDSRTSSVEVFWLPLAPADYKPQTQKAKFELARRSEWLTTPGPGRTWRGVDSPSQLAYQLDFVEMLRGNRVDDLGFGFELIYSDPPVMEANK